MHAPNKPWLKAWLSTAPDALFLADHSPVPHDFWQDLINVETSGPNHRTITKTAGAAWWDASGASCAVLQGDGWVQFTVGEETTEKVAGLSSVNPDVTLTNIGYGLFFSTTGLFDACENGVDRGVTGTYAAGDQFRVRRIGTEITYWHNAGAGWVLCYTSLVASSNPLIFDSSLYSVGATVMDVEFSGDVTNVGPFQNAVNLWVLGNVITKTNALGWDAGASSSYALNGNGYVEFTSNDVDKGKVAGLSHLDPDQNYTTIEYGINLDAAGSVTIYEMGSVAAGAVSTYVVGDRFRVVRTGTGIKYQQFITGSWITIYTSLVVCPTGPMLFDTSIGNTGGTLVLLAWSGASPRALFIADLTGNGHDVAQPDSSKLALIDNRNGVAPYLLFQRARGDYYYTDNYIDLDVNPYTVVAIYRWRSLVGAGDYQGMFIDGESYNTGIAYIQQYGVAASDALYHWPGTYVFPDQSPDLKLRSITVRETTVGGTQYMLSRRSGVDHTPSALAAQVAPAKTFLLGAWTSAYTSDLDLYALAFYKRSLSETDMNVVDRIIQRHTDLYSPADIGTTVSTKPIVGYRSDKNIQYNSNKIRTWGDIVDGNNLFQGNVAFRPLYVMVGGHPVIRFTAANLTLMTGTVLPLTGDYTVFAVRRVRSAPVLYGATWSNSNSANGMSDSGDLAGLKGLTHIGSAGIDWGTQTFGIEACIWRYNHGTAVASLQINGVDKTDTPLAVQVSPTGNLTLGTFGGYYTDVDFYEFWAWSRRLTDTETAELTDYAVRRYITFPILPDYSGYRQTGIMTNMKPGDIQPDVPGGGAGYSVAFGGGYVNMGNVCDFDTSDPFSLSCWVKLSGATGQYFMSKISSVSPFTTNGWGYGLFQTSTSGGRLDFILRSYDGATLTFLGVRTTNAAVNDGAWHHVVSTYDGSSTPAGIKLYIDGVEITNKTTTINTLGANHISNSGDFNISGYTDGGSALLTGSVDDAAVYDAALSPADVTAIYNGGVPGDLLALSSYVHLVGWWKMGD